MLISPQNQPAPVMPSPDVWWATMRRIVERFAATHAHVDIVITMKNGRLEMVRFNQSVLPGQLPRL